MTAEKMVVSTALNDYENWLIAVFLF